MNRKNLTEYWNKEIRKVNFFNIIPNFWFEFLFTMGIKDTIERLEFFIEQNREREDETKERMAILQILKNIEPLCLEKI